MKKFKEFIEKPAEQFIFNSHGSHSKIYPNDILEPDKEERIFNSHGSHSSKYQDDVTEARLSIKPNEVKSNKILPSLSSYISDTGNDHLGHISKYSDHTVKMDKLQEMHPHSDKAKELFKNYSNGSNAVTDLLLGKLDSKYTPNMYNRAVEMNENIKQHGHMPLKNNKLETYTGVGFDIRRVKPVGKTKEGHPVYDQPAHLSSSIDKTVARSFARTSAEEQKLPERHILHWHHDKNQPVGVMGRNSHYPGEHEVLVPSTDSHENRYHIAHLSTTSYHDPHDKNKIYKVHHVKRIPESEVVKG